MFLVLWIPNQGLVKATNLKSVILHFSKQPRIVFKEADPKLFYKQYTWLLQHVLSQKGYPTPKLIPRLQLPAIECAEAAEETTGEAYRAGFNCHLKAIKRLAVHKSFGQLFNLVKSLLSSFYIIFFLYSLACL